VTGAYPFSQPQDPYEDPATGDVENPPTLPLPVPSPDAEDPLVAIGDITVTQNWVRVPQGAFRLRGTTWSVQDSTQVAETIPAYAIVLAIVFSIIFCLLGLLFLLIKEQRYYGFIWITVTGDGLYHSVQIPPGPANAAWAASQVDRARALAAAAV
jgi:hypothetical protein